MRVRIAQEEEVVEIKSSRHGTKYVIDGSIEGPSGRRARVRTVWIVETDAALPRFVPGYPA